MGNKCKGSGDADCGIPYKMAVTELPELDDFFSSCENVLKTAEDIRSGLEDSSEDMNELARCYTLQNGNLGDSIQAWIWAVAANNAGDITRAGISLTQYAPYVEADVSWCSKDCRDFNALLQTYLQTCFTSKDSIEWACSEGSSLVTKGIELGKNAKDIATKAGKSLTQSLSAASKTMSNLGILKDGVAKMGLLSKAVQKAFSEIQGMMAEILKWISNAYENGQKAANDKLVDPKQCIKFVAKQPKLPKDIAAHEKAMLRKKQQKAAKKAKQGGGTAGATGKPPTNTSTGPKANSPGGGNAGKQSGSGGASSGGYQQQGGQVQQNQNYNNQQDQNQQQYQQYEDPQQDWQNQNQGYQDQEQYQYQEQQY